MYAAARLSERNLLPHGSICGVDLSEEETAGESVGEASLTVGQSRVAEEPEGEDLEGESDRGGVLPTGFGGPEHRLGKLSWEDDEGLDRRWVGKISLAVELLL